MRAIIARWEALSQSDNWLIRQAAWVARWNFLRAGALTAEEQGRFSSDYVDAIRSEKGRAVLLVLAQMNPSGLFPLGKWVRHLLGGNYGCRLAAGVAIHRWLVEVESSGQRVASGSEASGEWRVEVHYSLLTTHYLLLTTRHHPPADAAGPAPGREGRHRHRDGCSVRQSPAEGAAGLPAVARD